MNVIIVALKLAFENNYYHYTYKMFIYNQILTLSIMCTSHLADTVDIAQPCGTLRSLPSSSTVTSAPEPRVRTNSVNFRMVQAEAESVHRMYTVRGEKKENLNLRA